jgi:hypothetical protein
MAHVLAIRSERDSLLRLGLRSNKPLLGAVALTLALQLAVVSIPFLQGIFTTVRLSPVDLGICLIASSLIFWAVELEKWQGRRRNRSANRPRYPSRGAAGLRSHNDRESTRRYIVSSIVVQRARRVARQLRADASACIYYTQD